MILLFHFIVSLAAQAQESQPMTTPIFVKPGFSSVLEFPSTPTQAVIGDANLFQIERLNRSLVIKSLVLEGQSNLLVYFQSGPPKSFILTASEKSEPTFYKKIGVSVIASPRTRGVAERNYRATQVISKSFDAKKDYLTIEYILVSASGSKAKPDWENIYLKMKDKKTRSHSSWSERKEVQRDTSVRAKVVFQTPDVPRSLAGVSLVLPMLEGGSPIEFKLGGKL